jgi:hypothetical protein
MSEDKQSDLSRHQRSWLQRLLHWRADKTGDTIAAQIGEAAENVVVGKNIIQIIGNTLNIPLTLVRVTVASMLI